MSKDEYIYSYIESKLVDSIGKHNFNKERYKDEKVRKRNKCNC